ncbi:MAG: type II toxin-antitoxin system VapC family toxin [Phototrophicaceae bacterium]
MLGSIFQSISLGEVSIVTSVITLAEVLTHPMKLDRETLVEEYEEILSNSTGLDLILVDAEIARKSAALRAKYNLRTPDAIQLATALVQGCEAFITNDKGFKKVTDIRVILLEDILLKKLIEGNLDHGQGISRQAECNLSRTLKYNLRPTVFNCPQG